MLNETAPQSSLAEAHRAFVDELRLDIADVLAGLAAQLDAGEVATASAGLKLVIATLTGKPEGVSVQ